MKATAMAGLLGLAVLAGGGGALRAEDQRSAGAHGAHEAGMAGGKGAKVLHEQMKRASTEMRNMKMTGDVDHDFMMAMKQHHQHGIEMAQVVLREGKDPQAKEFAQKVASEQQQEIAELDKWLQQHPPKTTAKPASAK